MDFISSITPVLDCMCTALAEQGWEGQCCINPGMPAFDSCCESEGGTAWARLVRAYPSTNFPQEDFAIANSSCNGSESWAAVVEYGAVRCVCLDMCDCAVKTDNATKVLGDAQAALKGINCCFTSGSCLNNEYKIGSLNILGPQGGCGGFKIEITQQVYLNCCPVES